MENYINISKKPDSEDQAIEGGYKQLSGTEIKEELIGKQFLGSYLHGFKYIISINENGSLEGKNNYQHYDIGTWAIDIEKNTISVNWKNGWDNTTTHLYNVGEDIRMYDVETGELRTTLTQQINEIQHIEKYQF